MAKNLVIVESPAKAKTINKILGSDYVVKASMGHVRDLPEKQLGVDVEAGFVPKYVTIKGRQKTVAELQKAAEKVDNIYLAPDPDREGEAIAWHLVEALKDKVAPDHFYRVTYNEITASAIREAFGDPTRIDQNKVDAQQARRILDRIVGYKVSPLLWRRIKGASSAGRVQSVALRLVCEREDLIDAFVPQEYWVFGANVRKYEDPKDPFAIKLVKVNGENPDINSGEQAERARADLDQRPLKVAEIREKEISKRPRPPFITSSLQQAASSFLGYTPSRTMRIAQGLYEGVDFGEGPVGVITYMRTDSVAVSKEAQSNCRNLVGETYGAEYIPEKPNFYKSRQSAQEAHECIRPTDVTRTPEKLTSVLDPDQLKLYRLIWQRFVASQMVPARIAQKSVDIDAVAPEGSAETSYLFRATASEILFPGYMKASGVEKTKSPKDNGNGDEEDDVEQLPPLQEGESLECLEWLMDRKETKPPARYSEASLIRALEENGVGRPSTYAQTISTLDKREYVEREKRSLRPTPLGREVFKFLIENLDELFNVGFTAEMESELDDIEGGKIEWRQMLEGFYGKFTGWIDKAKGPAADKTIITGLLDLLGGVSEWAEPVKRGKRTYSDEKFVGSIAKQIADDKPTSLRQVQALVKLCAKYADQVGDAEAAVKAMGLEAEWAEATKAAEPPREQTLQKMDLLKDVTFDEPRTVGKKIYDDKVFCSSLREQVEGGKRLTVNQIRYLDRLVMKYRDQIPNLDDMAADLDLMLEEDTLDESVEPVLSLLGKVKEWKEPVQKGKRTWDDRSFFQSLSRQFGTKKSLSPKQVASLKKLAGRYATQIPDYEQLREQYGLPEPKKKKTADGEGS
ncbi:MAG: type I DNA topoisomerase [Verrucomicrobia bacterium]|nr:type I DNA topoisomerase [Verrucomicrobiota bacterium]